MTHAAFPMLSLPPLPPEPWQKAMIVMSEIGMPLRETEDLIEVSGSIIDYAKITDHVGLMERLSAAWLVERYGSEINFASVSPYDVVAVDAIRRGMHRKSEYRYIFGKHAGSMPQALVGLAMRHASYARPATQMKFENR